MYVSLIVAALTFVFALVFPTGSLGEATHYVEHVGAVTIDNINVGEFIAVSQSMTGTLVKLGIIFIVLAALMFITASHSRRKYYITNYISVGLFVVFALVVFVYILIMVAKVSNLFINSIDWAAVESNLIPEYPISKDDTFTFVLGFIVAAIVFVDAVFVVLSTVWKVLLMKGEQKLLEGSAKVETESVEEVA